MLDKLEAIQARFDEVGVALTNPEIVGNNQKFSALSKEYRSLEKIVRARKEYLASIDDVKSYREALNGNDEELREMAKERCRLGKGKMEYLAIDQCNVLQDRDFSALPPTVVIAALGDIVGQRVHAVAIKASVPEA